MCEESGYTTGACWCHALQSLTLTLPTAQLPMSLSWHCQALLLWPCSRAGLQLVTVWLWASLPDPLTGPCPSSILGLEWWDWVRLERPVGGSEFILVPHTQNSLSWKGPVRIIKSALKWMLHMRIKAMTLALSALCSNQLSSNEIVLVFSAARCRSAARDKP